MRTRQRAGATLASCAIAWGVGREGDDVSAFQEAVHGRGDKPRCPQNRAPLIDGEIAGENRGAVAVALMNKLIEDAGEAVFRNEGIRRMIADLVKDQETGSTVVLQHVIESVIGDRGQKVLEQIIRSDVKHAIAGCASPHTEADRQVALADAGGAEEKDRLTAVEEAKLGQVEDDLAIE